MTTAQRTRLRDLREQADIGRGLMPMQRAELERLEEVAREAAHAEALGVNAALAGGVVLRRGDAEELERRIAAYDAALDHEDAATAMARAGSALVGYLGASLAYARAGAVA